jgi:hypothetical protein
MPDEPATTEGAKPPAKAKPAAKAVKPAAKAGKPAVEAGKPAAEASKPAVEAGKPAAEAAKEKDEVPKKKAKNEAGKKVEVAFRYPLTSPFLVYICILMHYLGHPLYMLAIAGCVPNQKY